jgi:hypothetical protein
MMVILVIRGSKHVSTRFGEWVERMFEFYPAVNIEHKTERTNAFVTLVFGYSVVAIIYQNAASFGLNAFFGKAVLGLLQAFCFNWIYFDIDGKKSLLFTYYYNLGALVFLLYAPNECQFGLSWRYLQEQNFML